MHVVYPPNEGNKSEKSRTLTFLNIAILDQSMLLLFYRRHNLNNHPHFPIRHLPISALRLDRIFLILLMRILHLLLLLCLSTLFSAIKVDPQTSLFLDQYGRYTVYHGVNAVYKIAPFHPDLQHFSSNYSLTDHDLYNLKHWGMNVIRLHCAWEGVEPQPHQYNYTYIETIRDIVRKANKYGIYVLLDAHQDLFVRQFCGEGLPPWTAKRESFPAPLKVKIRYDDQGFPIQEDCLKLQFAKYYLTYDVMKLQRDFFTNQRGLLDHLARVWETVAAYLSEEPNLLGYQFINEPAGTNLYTDPAGFLLPGQSNNKYLLPAYKKLYQAIRKNDPYRLIFFEPSIFDVFAGGFYDSPGGQEQREKQVFSYHIYCPLVTPTGQPVSTNFCKGFDALQVASKEQNLQSLGVGGFLTEYGALSGTKKSAEEITSLTDLMAMHFRSWTYWQFKYYHDITTEADPATTESFYDEYGNLQINKVKALARPYAYAICGTPLAETFKKGVFKLEWVAKNCYNKNTELFLSDNYYFSAGFTATFSKNCHGCSLTLIKGEAFNFYQVIIGEGVGKRLSITIVPK